MFFQRLCVDGVGWDDTLTEDLLEEWKGLLSALQGPESLAIPRCYFNGPTKSVGLIGFCDASAKAYAAVVYLRLEDEEHVVVRFLAAKTRVGPLYVKQSEKPKVWLCLYTCCVTRAVHLETLHR